MRVTILRIKSKPRWKFWNLDNWEVTIKIEKTTKKVSIFSDHQYDAFLFLHWCIRKFYRRRQYGEWSTQFWDTAYEEYYQELMCKRPIEELKGKTFELPL